MSDTSGDGGGDGGGRPIPVWKRKANEPKFDNKVVKVGLDEWIVVHSPANGVRVQVLTDGLAGCVALCLMSNTQTCLAHVFSRCNQANWPEYEQALDSMRLNITATITGIVAVSSKGSTVWLLEQVVGWATRKIPNVTIERCVNFGIRVQPDTSGNGWSFFLKSNDPQSLLFERLYYNTETAATAGNIMASNGQLSIKAQTADLTSGSKAW